MQSSAKQMFRFADFTLDRERGLLLKAGHDIPLRRKSLEVLTYLLQHAGRVVPKDELLSSVWGTITVTDDSLTQCIHDIRSALLDTEGRNLVRTVARRGYMFPLEALTSSTQQGEQRPVSERELPSIAVLPFENLSDKADYDYFCDGMVAEITTALSCVRWLFVIARNSAYTYKGAPVDIATVGKELGVRYLLRGSVRRSESRIRIGAELVEAISGSQIWASRYEGVVEDIFDLQDRIAENVVGSIQPSIMLAEVERSRRRRPENLDAYDLVLRAFPLVWSLEREHNLTAQRLLQQALQHDPNYALAVSLLAWCYAQLATYNWIDQPDVARADSLRLAQKAVTLSNDDAMILAILGAAHTFAGNYEDADTLLRRAASLDPNSAWVCLRSAWLNVYQEKTTEAISQFERFQRLSPREPMGYVAVIGIGTAHFVAGRYEESIAWTRKGLLQQPGAAWALRHLTAALALAGRKEQAEESCASLLAANPGLTIRSVTEALPFRGSALTRILGGLRMAGLPE